MLPLGTTAPEFQLSDTDGSTVSLDDLDGSQGLVVAFISNHCPFVKHLRLKFAALADEFLSKGVSFVAIGSNDVENYPDDGPDKMAEEKKIAGYQFPYLYDETQEVAKPIVPLARRISTSLMVTENWSTVVSLTTVVLAMVDPSPARTFEVQSRK